jgi:hypothetical protein
MSEHEKQLVLSRLRKIGFKDVKATVQVDKLPREMSEPLQTILSKALSKSGWHNPLSGETLALNVRGAFRREVSSFAEMRIHEYKQEIPYTRYKENLRFVPGSSSCSYDGRGNGLCVNSPGQLLTEQKAVNDSYFVPQHFSYQVTRYNQSMQLQLSGVFALAHKEHKVEWADALQDSDYAHTQRVPAAGLFPKEATLERPERWLVAQYEKFGERLVTALRAEWKSAYCNDLAVHEDDASTERALRCLGQEGENSPAPILSWFEGRFGIRAGKDLAKLLDLNVPR